MMTREQINDFNSELKDSWNQGIYQNPMGVDHYDGFVVYQRHESGGVSGGSCWDDSNPQTYINDDPRPEWEALNRAIELICPDASYRQIQNIIQNASEIDEQWYGNYDAYDVWYVKLEDLYKLA